MKHLNYVPTVTYSGDKKTISGDSVSPEVEAVVVPIVPIVPFKDIDIYIEGVSDVRLDHTCAYMLSTSQNGGDGGDKGDTPEVEVSPTDVKSVPDVGTDVGTEERERILQKYGKVMLADNRLPLPAELRRSGMTWREAEDLHAELKRQYKVGLGKEHGAYYVR